VKAERGQRLSVVAAMNKREMLRFFAVTFFVCGLFALILFLARLEIG